MKTIGLIGGMSWESSAEYYRIMNETVKEELGGLHSVKCILYSVDFEEIAALQHKGEWIELTKLMIDFARRLEDAGADFIVITTNTMHKMAEEVQGNIHIPLLHIADATAEKIIEKGVHTPGLLGTKFTMEEDFYKGRLREKYELEVIVPTDTDRNTVDEIIYNELCVGIIKQASKEKFQEVIKGLVSNGADGVILGCTEIPLLISQEDVDVPLFDTTTIHSRAAVELALREE
ncbi:MAG: aspartate/glutamate racemase family protein [Deltaproteobacteria bacterium]|nr:aspartate/glutamate racemase family protein [Deltaproteobacteria bacterium]